jgi:hypothetical protein
MPVFLLLRHPPAPPVRATPKAHTKKRCAY